MADPLIPAAAQSAYVTSGQLVLKNLQSDHKHWPPGTSSTFCHDFSALQGLHQPKPCIPHEEPMWAQQPSPRASLSPWLWARHSP